MGGSAELKRYLAQSLNHTEQAQYNLSVLWSECNKRDKMVEAQKAQQTAGVEGLLIDDSQSYTEFINQMMQGLEAIKQGILTIADDLYQMGRDDLMRRVG